MKLHVQVIEARGLRATKANGASHPYVRLYLGNTKTKSSVIHNTVNPSWHEDFYFNVGDLEEQISVILWDQDRFADGFLGQVKLPVSLVLNAERQTIPCAWYTLEKRSKKSRTYVSGDICLGLSLYGKAYSSRSSSPYPSDWSASSLSSTPQHKALSSTSSTESLFSTDARASLLSEGLTLPEVQNLNKEYAQPYKEASLYNFLAHHLSSLLFNRSETFSRVVEHLPDKTASHYTISEESDSTDEDESAIPLSFFEDDGPSVEALEDDMEPPISGGILLDQRYAVSVKTLNAVLFRPGSQFMKDLVNFQKTTGVFEGPWKRDAGELPRRTLTYTKAATKMIKSVKAIEEQSYRRIDEKGFLVSVSVSTPDVPYGSNFRTELQFCLLAGALLPSGESTSRLCISWKLNFLTSTMMKGIIESGARQGLKDSFKQYAEVLEKYAKSVPSALLTSVPGSVSPKSSWELAKEHFCNFRVCLTLISFFVILVHTHLSGLPQRSGLEVAILDLPDSRQEFIISAFVAIQIEHILMIARRFLQARVCRASDHGIKAKGDGWLVSITLINAENLPPSDEIGSSDPYVVFTCNGKSRTSSVKLQTLNPEWKEIFEFDATEGPPSTMDLEVFDFDGPFTEAESLGHAEINFLKQNPEELADLWVTLQGRSARAFGSRVHLRILLMNTKEADLVTDYIQRVEKEVGKKISRHSPQKNNSFQRLFSLPFEEFLINDFACASKRKLPLQGRVFLSPRLLAFYSNIFGCKTKFTILWEDIEEIRETSPALGSVGMRLNPAVLVFTKKSRAFDARHGAKSIDVKGRFKFQFQSFVYFGPAYRTMTVLWKNRTLSPQQQMDILANIEEGGGGLSMIDHQGYDSGTFLGLEEANLVEVYSTKLPLSVSSMLLIYERENLDEKVAERVGCLSYSTTPWEPVGDKKDVQQRQINYQLNHQVCRFGSNVSCIQQKSVQDEGQACMIDEVLTLRDVPFADHFQIQVRKELENVSAPPALSECRVFVGIAWHKSTKFQQRISRNIFERFSRYLKESVDITVKEIFALKEECTSIQS